MSTPVFPDPNRCDDQGLVWVGNELNPELVLQAYSQGIFPWYEPGSAVLWWSPNPRLVLIPNEFKLSTSFKKTLKKSFHCTIDTAFQQVISSCATETGRKNNTWITEAMIQTYTQLHHLGYAHSFEVWHQDQLVGGLYGISLGRAFFGESMFHKVNDASKIAFYYLCRTLSSWDFDFIDCQLPTPHLQTLGAKVIPRQEFLLRLKHALTYPTKKEKWSQLG